MTVTNAELNDPSINICSGIRWLFQKQKLASFYLEREASWEEAVMNYKGKLKTKAEFWDGSIDYLFASYAHSPGGELF